MKNLKKLIDWQNPQTMNFGFIHSRYDLTNYGEYIWLAEVHGKELMLVVNEEHEVLRILEDSSEK